MGTAPNPAGTVLKPVLRGMPRLLVPAPFSTTSKWWRHHAHRLRMQQSRFGPLALRIPSATRGSVRRRRSRSCALFVEYERLRTTSQKGFSVSTSLSKARAGAVSDAFARLNHALACCELTPSTQRPPLDAKTTQKCTTDHTVKDASRRRHGRHEC